MDEQLCQRLRMKGWQLVDEQTSGEGAERSEPIEKRSL